MTLYTTNKIMDCDFRSDDAIELMRQSDIIITNPPFSLLRELVNLCVKEKKDFILLGNQNSVGYKEIFPIIQRGIVSVGYNYGTQIFKISESIHKETKNYIELNGEKYYKLGNICWLTTLPVNKKEQINVTSTYDINRYAKYENYDAINIDKISDIPLDYNGVMGVPLTYINKHDKYKFKIVGFRKGKDGRDLRYKKNGKLIEPYSRILIQKIS